MTDYDIKIPNKNNNAKDIIDTVRDVVDPLKPYVDIAIENEQCHNISELKFPNPGYEIEKYMWVEANCDNQLMKAVGNNIYDDMTTIGLFGFEYQPFPRDPSTDAKIIIEFDGKVYGSNNLTKEQLRDAITQLHEYVDSNTQLNGMNGSYTTIDNLMIYTPYKGESTEEMIELIKAEISSNQVEGNSIEIIYDENIMTIPYEVINKLNETTNFNFSLRGVNGNEEINDFIGLAQSSDYNVHIMDSIGNESLNIPQVLGEDYVTDEPCLEEGCFERN